MFWWTYLGLFCDRLLSLSIISARSIHVVACVRIPLLMLNNTPSYLIHLWTLALLPPLAIVINAGNERWHKDSVSLFSVLWIYNQNWNYRSHGNSMLLGFSWETSILYFLAPYYFKFQWAVQRSPASTSSLYLLPSFLPFFFFPSPSFFLLPFFFFHFSLLSFLSFF